jgi:glycosyltransferase involved in cell wall biosynthesis
VTRRTADFVMASNFGRTAGGRETWAYGFLPQLLAYQPELDLRVHGMRTEDHADTTGDLFAATEPAHHDRLKPVFHRAQRGLLPVFASMIRGLRSWMAGSDVAPPDWSLAAGCVNEQILVLATPKLRRSFRIVWLRTILLDQRIERIPQFLMPLARRVEAWLIGRSQLIIANGDDIAAYYARYGLKVEVIRNGIDARRWRRDAPALKGPLRVAFIGRLVPTKGIKEFLAAADLLKSSEGPSGFEFHVVGDGPYEDEVRAAADRGIIKFHGPVHNDELPALLVDFDVCVAFTFVSPTQGGGGTSNALLEQMAAARVIVGWNNAIFRQVLDQSNAWLVPQGDAAAVATALRDIAAHPEEARKRAQAAQRFVGRFSLEAQLEKFLALLRPHGLAD